MWGSRRVAFCTWLNHALSVDLASAFASWEWYVGFPEKWQPSGRPWKSTSTLTPSTSRKPELREEMCQPAGRMRVFRLRNVRRLNLHAAVSLLLEPDFPSPIITPCQFATKHSGTCFAMTLRTERVNRWSYSTGNCALLRTVLCDFSVLTNSGYWTIPAIFRLSPACNAAFKEAKNARAFGSKLGENSAPYYYARCSRSDLRRQGAINSIPTATIGERTSFSTLSIVTPDFRTVAG
jgi:hypothetical protein